MTFLRCWKTPSHKEYKGCPRHKDGPTPVQSTVHEVHSRDGEEEDNEGEGDDGEEAGEEKEDGD